MRLTWLASQTTFPTKPLIIAPAIFSNQWLEQHPHFSKLLPKLTIPNEDTPVFQYVSK
ncbi:MAG: hypothetical protein WAZ77_10660 [Candidatus Nitrosopolaris sp.]